MNFKNFNCQRIVKLLKKLIRNPKIKNSKFVWDVRVRIVWNEKCISGS